MLLYPLYHVAVWFISLASSKKNIDKLINENVENELLWSFPPCMGISFLFIILGDKNKTIVNKSVAFSFAWAIGSLYVIKEREKFHKYLVGRGFNLQDVQNGNTIFEWSLDDNWDPWTKGNITIDKRYLKNFSSLLIPTMDSKSALFLIYRINHCRLDAVSDRCPTCLLLGDSGTDKTSTISIYQKNFQKAPKKSKLSSATSPTNFQEKCYNEL